MEKKRHHLPQLRRFFVDEPLSEKGRASIKGQEARHIARVLRIGTGDRIILMDRMGRRFLACVESASSHEVIALIEETIQIPFSSPLEIILCQALLRSGPMDLVVQKTSELGVSKIMPFSSERTVVRPGEKDIANKLRRWNEIARSASKQSDRECPPEIRRFLPFADLLAGPAKSADLKVILWEAEETQDLKGLLRDREHGKGAVGVVGPEGGFSAKEIETARAYGFIPVSIGKRILRAETAAITLVAILQYEWGDLGRGKTED